MARINRQNRILYLSIQTLIEANIALVGIMTRARNVDPGEIMRGLTERRDEIAALLEDNPPPGLGDGDDDDDD